MNEREACVCEAGGPVEIFGTLGNRWYCHACGRSGPRDDADGAKWNQMMRDEFSDLF